MRTIALAATLFLALAAPALVHAAAEDDLRYGYQEARKGNYEEALHHFNRAVKAGGLKREETSRLYVNRGLTYYHLGKLKKALADLDHALKLNPKNAYGYNNRGLVHEKLGDKEAAIRDYKKALSINPNLWRTKDNLKRLGIEL